MKDPALTDAPTVTGLSAHPRPSRDAALPTPTAAPAAVRSGDIALALETAVRALVAFDATAPETEAPPEVAPDAATAGDAAPEPAAEKPVERDPAGEAHLATMLGVLCHHFFDYPRA